MSDELYEDIGESPEHRVGAWVLLVVGVLGLGLGLYLWRSRIVNAFATPVSDFKTIEEAERERIEGLKTKDTDADGLNDFDESYVFKTSPYLSDSDSDGDDDKTELESGDDPNCPKGSECGPAALPAEEASSGGAGASELDEREQVVKDLLNPAPSEIRELLLQSGMKKEDLDKIDDATLKELYGQALLEAQAQTN